MHITPRQIVLQFGAERRVTFDHGPDGSVAEDNYFGMVALREGYSFDFIEGEMWEKSPFTIYDFLQQRKRWLQGILLVVHSSHIPVGGAAPPPCVVAPQWLYFTLQELPLVQLTHLCKWEIGNRLLIK